MSPSVTSTVFTLGADKRREKALNARPWTMLVSLVCRVPALRMAQVETGQIDCTQFDAGELRSTKGDERRAVSGSRANAT